MKIKTVTVIGATGTMGSNIAGIFASFGGAKVYCVGRNIEKVKNTIPRIASSVRAGSITNRLIPADFSMLEDCVSESNLIFESSAEVYDVKFNIAKQVAKALKPDCISCTGTSGLSINKIAEQYPENLRHQFFGVHMFNPPYNMSLCELIPSRWSDKNLKEKLNAYLKKILLRTVVEVKDQPAFLGNRIGFQFINEALQYAEKYKDNGGIDYIDSILGPFTGRAMAPILTSDFVGLDIHKAIVDNLYQNTKDFCQETFKFPQYCENLVSKNLLGRKTKCGLYKTIKHNDGSKSIQVYDIKSCTYREKINYSFSFVDSIKEYLNIGKYHSAFKLLFDDQSQEAKICVHFLMRYIQYSIYISNEVANGLDSADDVMATGFNWCPPLALYNALSSITDVDKHLQSEFEKLTIEIKDRYKSKYDYRPFFKSGL